MNQPPLPHQETIIPTPVGQKGRRQTTNQGERTQTTSRHPIHRRSTGIFGREIGQCEQWNVPSSGTRRGQERALSTWGRPTTSGEDASGVISRAKKTQRTAAIDGDGQ